MWLIDKIAEQRIIEALKKGELDNLTGQGKPVVLEDDSHVPESLRVGYRMLKNAGYIPAEMQARKELADLRQLLQTLDAQDSARQCKVTRRINYLFTKIGMTNSGCLSGATKDAYYEKLLSRLRP